MLLRPRSLVGRYSPFKHQYINYREASRLWKRPSDPPFSDPPTPKEEPVLLKRASKKENKCRLYRLNVDDDQTINKISAIFPTEGGQWFSRFAALFGTSPPTKSGQWFSLPKLVPTQTSPPIARVWRTLDIPKRIAKPLMKDPVPPDTMFVLYSALFMEEKNDPKFYAADYPKECRLSTDHLVLLDLPPSDAQTLRKILAKTNNWHPYARIFVKYMSGGGILPVKISLREPVLPESLEGERMIDSDEINCLEGDLVRLSARRATIIEEYDEMVEAAEKQDTVITPKSHGRLEGILAQHGVTEEASKEPDTVLTPAAKNSWEQSLLQLIASHLNDVRYNEKFDDNIADNYFGFQIGLTFFAECCEKFDKRLIRNLRIHLSGKMSLPPNWKKENEVFQLLGEVRCNADALAAYGRFLPKPPDVDQAPRDVDHQSQSRRITLPGAQMI
jgi:hypothetical protein